MYDEEKFESYYEGYLLDVNEYELNETDRRCLACCFFIVDNSCSQRKCARELLISRKSIWRYVIRCKRLSSELYQCVIRVRYKYTSRVGYRIPKS